MDIHGNGERAEEQRPLDGFSRVEMATSVSAQIVQGAAFDVRLSLDSNVLPELETRVVNDTLLIDSEHDLEDLVLGPHVFITLPVFRSVALSGSGDIEVMAVESAGLVELALSGSGSVTFEGSVLAANVRLSGSGDVVLVGTGEHVGLTLDGSGNIDARQLEAANGVIDLSGSGSIRASSHGPVEVDLSGSGDVYLYGAPDVTRLSIDGSGEVHRL